MSLETLTPIVLSRRSLRPLICLDSISLKLIESTEPMTSESGTGYFAEITIVSSNSSSCEKVYEE